VSVDKLPREVVSKLKSWQLYTLVSKKEVIGIFLDNLEYGSPETGRPFSTISAAFFHSIKMAGFFHKKLRRDYERVCERTRGADTSDSGSGGQGEGDN
jgi:hypothetical protein